MRSSLVLSAVKPLVVCSQPNVVCSLPCVVCMTCAVRPPQVTSVQQQGKVLVSFQEQLVEQLRRSQPASSSSQPPLDVAYAVRERQLALHITGVAATEGMSAAASVAALPALVGSSFAPALVAPAAQHGGPANALPPLVESRSALGFVAPEQQHGQWARPTALSSDVAPTRGVESPQVHRQEIYAASSKLASGAFDATGRGTGAAGDAAGQARRQEVPVPACDARADVATTRTGLPTDASMAGAPPGVRCGHFCPHSNVRCTWFKKASLKEPTKPLDKAYFTGHCSRTKGSADPTKYAVISDQDAVTPTAHHSTAPHSTPLHSTPLHSTPLHSTPLLLLGQVEQYEDGVALLPRQRLATPWVGVPGAAEWRSPLLLQEHARVQHVAWPSRGSREGIAASLRGQQSRPLPGSLDSGIAR